MQLPPAIAAAAKASTVHLKSSSYERAGQRAAVEATKSELSKAGLNIASGFAAEAPLCRN
jgi:5-aminolevulinate synthase